MSTFDNHANNMINADVCLFDLCFLGSSRSLQGVPVTTVQLAGYLALGPQPIILPLYCPPIAFGTLKQQLSLFAYLQTPMIHNMAYKLLPSNEVPVYVLALSDIAAPFLNLPWLKGKTGNDKMLHGVYDYLGVAWVDKPLTIVHLAQFPLGYQYIQADDLIDELESILQTTWIDSSAMASAAGVVRSVRPKKKKVQAEHTLHGIMKTCPNWGRALAYLHTDNPHLLTNVDYGERRLELARSLWPSCLNRANITIHDLETVLNKDSKLPMSQNEVLALSSPWITQFLYDTRRVITISMDDARIFGLSNFFGVALKHSIGTLLQMFTRPHAHLLPIWINGFYAFLIHQAGKELVYHVIFRTTATNCIRFTIADLEPAVFRLSAHPPVDTLALVGSCCYQSLLTKLMSIWGTADVMPQFPPVSQVHTELRETAVMLLQQDEDPDIVMFRGQMRVLCNITLSLLLPSNFNMVNTSSAVPFTFEVSSYSHFLGIEQTETAMICWLQKQEHDTLPDSLFATASVLFGWIDSHNLIALLDVSLREVAMQLEREHDFGIVSCLQGRWWMEDRMHQAQTEISLFSTAIANLCEEMECRSSPNCLRKLPTMGDVACMKTCLSPSLVNFDDVRPIQVMPDKCDARDKCNAWLIALQGNTLDDSDPNDRFLSLPRLLKIWVDNTTYRTYIIASLAEFKPSYNRDSFKTKECKSLTILKSDLHMLGLKKQCAQVEVDMLSEAIARMSEFKHTDDGISSGSSMMCVSCLPETSVGSFDDWLSSYTSSDISSVM
ncbi:uncharacterized protein F5147DRAFT_777964 [Suillus discolor]|uniref:Uncharacterized protein n=1 Tax=Suillus discolor TaxID=1912936 RepID=A0A9P7EZY6_9AGAM|nr:uncharacterized protein F5147DRAFT_777964 [Suillus discolor]KAG2097513.1 hypothetical protein F5147DRAFT_777964 [Suillus discolor]